MHACTSILILLSYVFHCNGFKAMTKSFGIWVNEKNTGKFRNSSNPAYIQVKHLKYKSLNQ